MTGPEHYQEAEKLLTAADALDLADYPTPEARREVYMTFIAAAQVHATLAQAAATGTCAGLAIESSYTDHNHEAWDKVAGVKIR